MRRLDALPPRSALPPGPPLPRIVQTALLVLAHPWFVRACHRRYGDLVSYRSLIDPCFVFVCEPGLVKELARGAPDRLRAGEANGVLEPIMGSHSVFVADGAEHLRRRKLLLPAFHGERMRGYEQAILDATDAMIDAWPVGSPFRALGHTQELTLDIIANAVFGIEDPALRAELVGRIKRVVALIGSRPRAIVHILTGGRVTATDSRAFAAARDHMDVLVREEIARRRTVSDLEARTDMLSTLLCARDETGEPMSDDEVRDELVTLLVAGHETTATALAWALELLARHPRERELLAESLERGENERLDAVIRETLRLRPPILSFGRVVRGGSFEIGGHSIPEGVGLEVSIVTMHGREQEFPDPNAFRPDRFLGPDPPDTYTWVPFGGGVRRCIGASFAHFELRIALTRILERTRLEAHGRPARMVRRSVTLSPDTGVRLRQPVSPVPAARTPTPTAPAGAPGAPAAP